MTELTILVQKLILISVGIVWNFQCFQYLGSTLVRELVGTESTIEGITKLKVGVWTSDWGKESTTCSGFIDIRGHQFWLTYTVKFSSYIIYIRYFYTAISIYFVKRLDNKIKWQKLFDKYWWNHLNTRKQINVTKRTFIVSTL